MPRTRSELYAFVAILLTALGMLAGATIWAVDDGKIIDKENMNQIVQRAVAEHITKLKK